MSVFAGGNMLGTELQKLINYYKSSPTPDTLKDLQMFIREHRSELLKQPVGCGEFKDIFKISDDLAVAICSKSSAENIFKQEEKLLTILNAAGIQAIHYHGHAFKLDKSNFDKNDSYAVVMDFIPNTTAVEAKELATCGIYKLFGLLLNVKIPKGEAWPMHKARIDNLLRQKIASLTPLELQVIKQKAAKIMKSLNDIMEKLETNHYMINDLQFLINDKGEIWIIDPQDVARVEEITPNKYEYFSLLDEKQQTNDEYISFLHDSQKLMLQFVDWCENVCSCEQPQDLINLANIRMQSDTQKPRIPLQPFNERMPTASLKPAKKHLDSLASQCLLKQFKTSMSRATRQELKENESYVLITRDISNKEAKVRA